MARSIALTNGFADAYALPTPAAPRRTAFGRRIMDWLTKSQQHGVEREIECRFLARQPDRF